MTISTEYSATKHAYFGQTTFAFSWECLGLQALEVWAETETDTPGTYARELLAPQDYYVTFGGGTPTALGGTVTLTGTIASTVDRISIERNTPITQLADLKNFTPFKMPLLEAMLDKMIMILQELLFKKCGISFTSPALQPYVFREYTVLYASVVDTAIEAVAYYILLIDADATDCKADPEGA